MTALPDTFMPEGPLRHQRQVPLYHMEASETGVLRRVTSRCTGAALLMAAAGLWLVPVIDGDAMMQLYKLAFSGVLAVVGAILLTGGHAAIGPEVHLNPHTRQLTIIERDAHKNIRSQASHDIDTLGDVVLRDGLLTARCGAGLPLMSLPVTDPKVEAALHDMLAGRGA
ncbi:hypothetical protein ACEWPM_012950 [Roseovarius sp. S4756]|uniref:hypothetical protein n=1 Tax=Roseovarius maritimus TaxID=3342637 RepID=UPI0037293F0B